MEPNTREEQDKQYRTHNQGILDARFCLISTIGDGGTAVVKLAWDLELHQFCAIKLLKNLT